ncbi:carbon starvation CstA family protein, partial [Novilysobacter longmucuonensis]|uniref:carbon starvation CstA family protein n=1 Tax=Novilysobacter longmucuonensis TaxID=3098603 RepID=UPI003FA054B4
MLVGLAMMALGFFLYSSFLANRIFKLQASFRTPAHELRDDVDFVPTNKFV